VADPIADAISVLKSRPTDPAAWTALGDALLSAGAMPDAIDAFQKAATLAPTGKRVFRLAAVLQQAGQTAPALGLYRQAVQLSPRLGPAWHNLGGLLAAAGALEEAEQAFVQVVTLDGKHARGWCNLGVVRRQRGRHHEACRALERAVALQPDYGLALANLAGAQEQSNQPDRARATAERALRHLPNDPVATLVLARLDRADGNSEAALERLDGLLGTPLPADLLARLQSERGQALDRLGRAEEAYAAFAAANEARGSTPAAAQLPPDGYPALVRTMSEATEELLAHGARLAAPTDGLAPIFLVGFPRSGTTLTERILAAHPALRGSDEVPLLEGVLRDLGATGPAVIEALLQLDEAGRDRLRERYRELAEVQLGPSADRLVDKLPLNLVYLGALGILFPDAPLIVILRDPRDGCLSCFMQDFVLNAAMVQLLDLERIVALQEQVLGLWLDHREAAPQDWMELRYEDVVADQPAAAARLLEHVGVPWDPAVTRYWEGARGTHISTPSHQDVGKPIFTRARGRWRRYEPQLSDVRGRLDALATRLGYDS